MEQKYLDKNGVTVEVGNLVQVEYPNGDFYMFWAKNNERGELVFQKDTDPEAFLGVWESEKSEVVASLDMFFQQKPAKDDGVFGHNPLGNDTLLDKPSFFEGDSGAL